MSGENDLIRFEILNERFTIKSNVSPDYYRELVEYLQKSVEKIRKKAPNLSHIKVLTFAALDIIDELMKTKDKTLNENDVQLLSELSESLASAMDDSD